MINYDEILDNIGKPTVEAEGLTERASVKDCRAAPCIKGDMLIPESGVIVAVPPHQFDITAAKTKLGIEHVAAIVAQAEELPTIETDEDAHKGVSIALSARRLSKDIGTARRELTAPAVAFQKSLISLEKEYTEQLSDVESTLLSEVDEYQESRKKLLLEHNVIDPSADILDTAEGSSSVKSFYEFKIIDVKLIPAEFLKLDTTAINASIKKGIRNIPGIEIYKSQKRQYRLKSDKTKEK